MASEKNYTKYAFLITLLVIVLLGVLCLVPPFRLEGVVIKRVNIFSDVAPFVGDAELKPVVAERPEDQEFLVDSEAIVDSARMQEAQQMPAPETETWKLEGVAGLLDEASVDESARQAFAAADTVVAIEDFTPEEGVSVADFCRRLQEETPHRLVRIAFLGDSYIEGDIITADVREQLQALYGGRGVGFVPFATPLAANRGSLKQTYEGWETYNLIHRKSAPEELRDKFYVSGVLCRPDEEATVRYEGNSFRKHLWPVSGARLLFVNTGHSELQLVVNDSIRQQFTPQQSELVQQISLSGGAIHSLEFAVKNPAGFFGYGVVFESRKGVGVDNYSIRGNSGLALFGSSSAVNSQIDHTLNYDLIVLQYGLNAMDPQVTDYAGYGSQLRKVIRYVKGCFPQAAVLVMSVGDRSTMKDGVAVTMPGVMNMVEQQRTAARECGVAFWSTFQAMGGENSMPVYVERGWAAKDYTHLGYAGGREIANELVKALLQVERTGERKDRDTVRNRMVDSLPGEQYPVEVDTNGVVETMPIPASDTARQPARQSLPDTVETATPADTTTDTPIATPADTTTGGMDRANGESI